MIKVAYTMEGGLEILVRETVHKGHLGRLVKGSPSRKRWWKVTGSYMTPQGLQEFTVEPVAKCYLAELKPFIENEMRADALLTGGLSDVKWTAVGR